MPSRTHKRCPMCGEVKSLGDFPTKPERGRVRHEAYCEPCRRAYNRLRYAHRYRTDAAFRERKRRRMRARHQRDREDRRAGRQWMQTAAQRHVRRLLDHGWTLTRIGRELGVSGATVAGWVRGRWAPRPARLRALRSLADQVTGPQTRRREG